jgi:hypothetical protein
MSNIFLESAPIDFVNENSARTAGNSSDLFSYIIKVLQLGYGLDHFWCFIIKAHFVVYSPTIR